MYLIIMGIVFVVMLVLGFPIYIALFGGSVAYMFLNPDLSMMMCMQKMMNAVNSFPLLAVPFFLFAGQVFNTGGITKRIFKFANHIVGHFKGGLGYVNIFSSVIFSGMSGSALADVGGLGVIEVKAMRDAGYDDGFILGVTGASATVGPIIPPSIPFVIYGAFANVSIGALFMGGFIPGLIMALTLSIMVFILSKKRNYPTAKRATFSEIWNSTKEAYLALLTPIIIIGGMWTGFFTPTEAAFVSIVWGLIISIFVYKELKFKDIARLMLETIKLEAPATIVVVTAVLFGWIMNYEKFDQIIINALFGITTNKNLILLIINIILLIMGMLLDPTAAIILLIPVLGPLTRVLGMNPIHFGVMMVLNLMIGLLTPPVGFSLYILSTMTGYPIDKIFKMVSPWLIPLVVALILVTYFPDLVLFLPKLFGIA